MKRGKVIKSEGISMPEERCEEYRAMWVQASWNLKVDGVNNEEMKGQ